MAKIEVTPITSGYNVAALNETLQNIENEFKDKVVYRDEVSPMERPLDMNGNDILNAAHIFTDQLTLGGVSLTPSDFDPDSSSAATLRGDLLSGDGAAIVGYTPAGAGAVVTDVQSRLRESDSVFSAMTAAQRAAILARTGTIVDDAIEAVLNDAAGKRRVYMPGGVYLTTREIKVPSNSYIYGDGPGKTVIIRVAGSAADQNGFTNSNNTRNDSNTGNENIVIRDLEIVGALGETVGSVGSGTTGCGIGLAFVKNAVIQNVFSRNWTKHCFDVSAKYYWTSATANPTTYVPGPSEHVVLRDCVATVCGDDLITTHFSGPILIENPHCYGANSPTSTAYANRNGLEIDDGSYDVTVIGGLYENCNSGIEIKGHDYAPAAKRVRIYSPTIRNCYRGFTLRHQGWYGPVAGQSYSDTAADVYISGATVFAPSAYVAAALIPKAVRLLGYRNVTFDGLTVIQTEDVLGGNPGSEEEITTSPIHVYHGAQDVTFNDLSVIGYTAAAESLVRVTGSGRGGFTLKNASFKNCADVPCVYVSGSLPGVGIDGIRAERPGTGTAPVVLLSYQPETVGTEIKNINSAAGYAHAALVGSVAAQGLPGMNFGTLSRWVVADSIGGASTAPQDGMAVGWTEGGQDLGIGEGVKYSFRMKLNGNATLWEGAYTASYKESALETDTSTALRFATRATADAGTGATDKWEIGSDGGLRPVGASRPVGSATQSASGVWVNGVLYTTGTGTPEGVVVAPVGSRYDRIDGAPGTYTYRKNTGTGNTGWTAIL
jgi:hypothetical protein